MTRYYDDDLPECSYIDTINDAAIVADAPIASTVFNTIIFIIMFVLLLKAQYKYALLLLFLIIFIIPYIKKIIYDYFVTKFINDTTDCRI